MATSQKVHPSTRLAFVAALAALHVVLVVPALFNTATTTTTTTTTSDCSQGKLDGLMVVMFGSIAGAAAIQHWHNLAQIVFVSSPVDVAFPSSDRVASLSQLAAAGFGNSCQVRNSFTALF